MTGWERLVTTRDAAERAVLRLIVLRAVEDHAERRNTIPPGVEQRLERLIQRGVAQAFKS